MQPYLTLLVMLPTSYCLAAFVGLVVPLKKGQLFPLIYLVSSGLIWILNNILLPRPIMFLDSLNIVSAFVLLLFLVPKNYRFQALFVQGMLFLTLFIGNFLTLFFYIPIMNSLGYTMTELMDPSHPATTQGCLIASILTCPMLYGTACLLRKKMPILHSSSGLSVFLFIPISQILMIGSLLQYAYAYLKFLNRAVFPADVILVMAFNIGADIAFILLFQRFHREELVRASAKQAETQLSLQNQYYRDIQDSILSVNQIRHDLNNQLQAAYYLLSQGRTDQVQQQLDLIRDSLRQRVGSKYCENMMVDAVLCEKCQHCQSLGIAVEVSVFLPAQLPIENAHLCSLFANLLDNAIVAVRELGGGTISVQADLQGKLLTVFCRNPSKPPKKKAARKDLLREHGLGLEILSQLAALYGGHVDTEFREGCFETTVILRLPEEAE